MRAYNEISVEVEMALLDGLSLILQAHTDISLSVTAYAYYSAMSDVIAQGGLILDCTLS